MGTPSSRWPTRTRLHRQSKHCRHRLQRKCQRVNRTGSGKFTDRYSQCGGGTAALKRGAFPGGDIDATAILAGQPSHQNLPRHNGEDFRAQIANALPSHDADGAVAATAAEVSEGPPRFAEASQALLPELALVDRKTIPATCSSRSRHSAFDPRRISVSEQNFRRHRRKAGTLCGGSRSARVHGLAQRRGTARPLHLTVNRRPSAALSKAVLPNRCSKKCRRAITNTL